MGSCMTVSPGINRGPVSNSLTLLCCRLILWLAAATSPGMREVRITARSLEIGFCSATGASSGSNRCCNSGLIKLNVIASLKPRPTNRCLIEAFDNCVSGNDPTDAAPLSGATGIFSYPTMRAISSIRSTSRPISKRQLGAVHSQVPPLSPGTIVKPKPEKIRVISSSATSMPNMVFTVSLRNKTGLRCGRSDGDDTSTTDPASPPTHSSSIAVARSIALWASSGSTPRS